MLRRIFSALFLLCASVGAAQSATLTKVELDAQCQRIFNDTLWHESRDDEAKALAEEFLPKLGIHATVVICSGAVDPRDVAASYFLSSGFERYFFIALNSEMRLAISSELRGIIAHEVGHEKSRVSCETFMGQKDSEAYEACEHAADAAGEMLAGRGQVARSLGWVATYLRQSQGDSEPKTEDIVYSIYRRISLLR